MWLYGVSAIGCEVVVIQRGEKINCWWAQLLRQAFLVLIFARIKDDDRVRKTNT